MGHRALLAVERATDRYDVHRSQWGAHEWQLATDASAWTAAVDGPAVATDCSWATVCDTHLDYQRHEALVVVDGAGLTPHLVCWFGLGGSGDPGDGAVVAVDPARPLADGEFLRGWVAGTKGLVARLVDAGTLDPKRGRELLAERVGTWRGERAVRFGPGAPARES